jgi:GAF domain-containing protein
MNDHDLQTSAELWGILNTSSPGDTLSITLQNAAGERTSIEITLQTFPSADRFTYQYVLYFVGLIFFGCSIWVYRLRRTYDSGQAFALFATSFGIVMAGMFDTLTTHRLVFLWSLAVSLSGGALLHLTLVYPREGRLTIRYPFTRWVGYLAALVVAIMASLGLPDFTQAVRTPPFWQADIIFSLLCLLVFLVSTAVRSLSSPSPLEREQSRIILWGSLIAFVPISLRLLGMFPLVSPTHFLWPIAVFPLAVAYTILRYRIINTAYVLSRGVMYAILSVIAGLGYALLVSGMSLLFGSFNITDNPFFIGLMFFILALALNPLRLRLQKAVNEVFLRGEETYREKLVSFSRELTHTVNLFDITLLLRQHIKKTLLPVPLHIFLYNPLTEFYSATPDDGGQTTTDLWFDPQSGIVQILSNRQVPIFISDRNSLPRELYPEKNRLALLGGQLFIGLPGQERLLGWMALGPPQSGESYSTQDINFLTAMSEQAAVAIERAQVLEDKDRRVHELDVLTRVAQGVNITLAFDDILELIYAQTSQVIPVSDLNITLKHPLTQNLSHAFYLEDDERLTEREHRHLPPGQGLEQTVLDTQRPIITEDYELECQNRMVLPGKQGLFAWMGIPLNAGADTIGVISIGSRNPSIIYSNDQSHILQAIANQAAGAIVKARLLDISEHRARQLATLNEVARSLTSTLDIDLLLNRILQSAVDILNCEAGSLLLANEITGELVYEVVIGPVADDLIGDHLDPGVGIIGKAYQTKVPQIVNNVQVSQSWYQETDKQTGFVTSALLAVPMIVKEQVIGVIEVINKLDGLPFDSEDQELLTAFTGQAAIAVDNARLYTLTDQALASRVEELSVMQRIDRELNTSLDVRRAMEITLEWAMRQSDTTAGLIGVVEEGGLKVMASEGYRPELETFEDQHMSLDFPGVRDAITSGQVQYLTGESLRWLFPSAGRQR